MGETVSQNSSVVKFFTKCNMPTRTYTHSVNWFLFVLIVVCVAAILYFIFGRDRSKKVHSKKSKLEKLSTPFNNAAFVTTTTAAVTSTPSQPPAMNVSSSYYANLSSSPFATFNSGVHQSTLPFNSIQIGNVSLLTTDPTAGIDCQQIIFPASSTSSTSVYICRNIMGPKPPQSLPQYDVPLWYQAPMPQVCFTSSTGSIGCSSSMFCMPLPEGTSTRGVLKALTAASPNTVGVCIPRAPSASATSTPFLGMSGALPSYVTQLWNTCTVINDVKYTPDSWTYCPNCDDAPISSSNVPYLQEFLTNIVTPNNQPGCFDAANWGYGRNLAFINTPYPGQPGGSLAGIDDTVLVPGTEAWQFGNTGRGAWISQSSTSITLCNDSCTPKSSSTYMYLWQPQISGSGGGISGLYQNVPPLNGTYTISYNDVPTIVLNMSPLPDEQNFILATMGSIPHEPSIFTINTSAKTPGNVGVSTIFVPAGPNWSTVWLSYVPPSVATQFPWQTSNIQMYLTSTEGMTNWSIINLETVVDGNGAVTGILTAGDNIYLSVNSSGVVVASGSPSTFTFTPHAPFDLSVLH